MNEKSSPTAVPHSELENFKYKLLVFSLVLAVVASFLFPRIFERAPWFYSFNHLFSQIFGWVSIALLGVAAWRMFRVQTLALAFFTLMAIYFSGTFAYILFYNPSGGLTLTLALLVIAPYLLLPVVWVFSFFNTRWAVTTGGIYIGLLTAIHITYLLTTDFPPSKTMSNALNQVAIMSNVAALSVMIAYSYLTDQVMVTEEKKSRLEDIALGDALTGLPNRRFLNRVLENEVSRFLRYQTPFVVAIVDLDHFKKINDALGHPVGDAALKASAKILRESLRPRDWVGRWGGEEFLVIFSDTQIADAATLLEKCRSALAGYRDPQLPPVTASFGAAAAHLSAPQIEDLLKRADAALYRAKQSGRNRIEISG